MIPSMQHFLSWTQSRTTKILWRSTDVHFPAILAYEQLKWVEIIAVTKEKRVSDSCRKWSVQKREESC